MKENIENEAVLVPCPPEPVSDAVYRGAKLIRQPPETPTGFPVRYFFRKAGNELYAPLAEGLVADLNAALVEQFLDFPVAAKRPRVLMDAALAMKLRGKR